MGRWFFRGLLGGMWILFVAVFSLCLAVAIKVVIATWVGP
jgi:hypothetical protein